LPNATGFALFWTKNRWCFGLPITVCVTIAIYRLTVFFFSIRISLSSLKKNQEGRERVEEMPYKTKIFPDALPAIFKLALQKER